MKPTDSPAAEGPSLKELSPAQYERLNALLDESIGMTAAERDPWLAALENREHVHYVGSRRLLNGQGDRNPERGCPSSGIRVTLGGTFSRAVIRFRVDVNIGDPIWGFSIDGMIDPSTGDLLPGVAAAVAGAPR
jgi:hypothetical protein